MHKLSSLIHKNLANAVSILGVLPLCLLFQEGGYQYLIPLMIYGNAMDDFNAAPYLMAAFVLHTVPLLVPYKLPYLIRGMTTSVAAITLVNVALIVAWQVPSTTAVVGGCFIVSYLYSLVVTFLPKAPAVSFAASSKSNLS